MTLQRIKHEEKKLTAQVQVFLIPEGEQYVAYCPALELSTYGSSPADAKAAFAEAMEIFVEDTQAKGTLEKVLLGLGWTLQQRPVARYEPPRPSVDFLNTLGSGKRGKIRTVNQQLAVAY